VNQPKPVGVKAEEAQAKPASSSTMESHDHEKSKKSIDWSNYLGIDKRVGSIDSLSLNSPKPKAIGYEQGNSQGKVVENQSKSEISASPTSQVSTVKESSKPATNSLLTPTAAKESNNQLQDQEETTTQNKDDRNWMLHEFYKNFAMSTNVKRKRESPP